MFKHFIRALILLLGLVTGAQAQIVGAGSSLSNALMQSLTKRYSEQQHVELNYHSVGSGEGIRRLVANSIDFSLSDVPLNAYEQSALGLVQWPLFFSGITPVVNLPGVKVSQLHLDGPALAAIFQGRITQWNAPALQTLNPQLVLPALPIQVIYRSDSSGSTFAFTSYLATVSSNWSNTLGSGSRLTWPVGQGVAGGEGVARAVAKMPGSISYLEFGGAEKQGLSMPQLQTRGGEYVNPSPTVFRAALNGANWDRSSFYQPVLVSSATQAWPLVTTTFVLVPRHPEDATTARQTLAFLQWASSQTGLVDDQHLLSIQDAELLNKIHLKVKTLQDESSKESKK
jgi:phosphate transport system substrate-binding protein